ncbi:PAS domain S-box protein [Microcoleus sp. MON1_C5]|uniref:PAS domain S-box protein n=1 Tax=Microcoleus sp. MON1_C5 TaxID=2818828 RepID=UPI002FD4B9C9
MSKFPPDKNPPQQESTTAQALRQAHFDAFFAGANAGLMILDSQLRYVQINQAMAELNGICVADHIGRSLCEVLPELAATLEPILQGILATGQPILDYEVAGETPKEPGIVRYWEASYYPLRDENGRVFGLGGIVIEVSDRKRAEQKQARLTAILEATSDLVGVVDVTGHSVYLNKAGQEMLGMSPEEARSPFTIDSVLAPSAKAKFHNEIIPTALRDGSWAGEILFLSRDGEEVPVSQVLIVHKTEAGEVEFISTIARDIRDRKKAEEERQLLATTIENSRDFISVASMDGRPILVNQAGLDLVGVSSLEEARTKHITDFFMAEDLDFVQQSIMPAIMQEGSWRSDFRFRHFVTGQPIAVDYTLFLVNHPETNEPVGIATITRDIRDRKTAEDVLKQSEERFRSLVEASAQIVWNTSAEGEFITPQPGWSAFTGQTFDEYKGWGWLDKMHSDDRSYIATAWSTAVANRSLYEVEFRMRRYDGEYRYMSCRGVPILNADGSIREWIGANTDITDRKQAEEALREQQAALRDRNVLLSSILESTPDIIVVKDREGRYVALNSDVAKSFYGKTIEEILGKDDSELLPPEAAVAIMAKDREIMEAGTTESYEEDVSNGKESISFLTTKAPWRDAQGNIIGLIAIARNIADRKQMEAELRDRNALLNSILENTPDFILVKDREGRYVALNSNLANFFGKPIKEVIGKNDLEILPPDIGREVMAKDRQIMAAGIIDTYEEDIFSHSETTRTFFTTKAPWRDNQGNILGIIGITRDISDRKKVEQTLRQTLEILDLASDSIIIRDMDDRIIYWNQGAEKLYGWTKAEVVGQYIHTFLETVFPQPLETILAEFFQQGSWEGELHHTTRDGRHIIVASRWTLQRDGEGKPCAQLEINNDISDRKQAEDAIKQSEGRYRSLIAATSQLVWTADAEGRCVDQPGWRAYTGQTQAEMADGFGWLDAIHPDDRERTTHVWMEAVHTKTLYDVQYRIRGADGNYRYFQLRGVPILDEDGSLLEWIGTCSDIHDRKQAEDALKQSEERYRSLILATSQIAWTADAEGRSPDLPSWRAYTGQTEAEVIGLGWLDAIHPDDRERAYQVWMEAAQTNSLYDIEYRIRGADGNYRYFQARGVPILNEDGSLREWVGTCSDIHDRKQAEDAIKQSEERYRSLIAATSQIVWVSDAEGRCPDLPSMRAYTGQTEAEVVGFGWLDVIHPDDRERTSQVWMEAAQTRSLYEIQYRMRAADGNYRYFQVRGVPILNEDGSVREWVGTCTDIHDRKQAEDAIKQSEERYRSLIVATSQIVWTADAEGQCPDLPTMRAYTGQSVAEVIGLGWLDTIHPDDRERTNQVWMEAVQTKTLYDIEYRIRGADGNYRYFQGRGVPILNEDGSIREWVGTCSDIHDRKQAEDAIKQSEERYRSLIVATSQIAWTADAEGRSPDLPSWRAYTGQTVDEVVGLGWLDAIHPDDRERTNQVWMEAVQTTTLYDIEYRIRGADGNYRYFQVRGVPILDEEGSVREWVGTCSDIHDRKQAEDTIKQSEERYRSLILAISQIVWTTDAEGRCQDTPSMRAYTGQTEAEVVGFGWLDTIHSDDRERTVQVWMEAVETKSLFEMEYRMRGSDGNYRYFQARAVPILNEDGSIREWVGTCIDIHDRKQAEFVMAKAKEAAEAASRAKSEFLANMSHELRTPLNGIMGYAQILQRSKVLNQEERSRIDVIYQCGSHLLTLINDILDLSKIEAQKVELMPTDFHFPAFLQGVAEMCRIRAEIKGIQFHFPSSTELPIGIRADEKRLRQVLFNLLSNAIKFTDQGSVTFIVSFATEGKIRFEVRDTGTGIAQEQLQAIFQPFEQVGDRKRQTEGTGLGLAISQRIVELMGSTIQVQSEMNVGSIFWFDVSLPQADEWVKTSQIDHHGQIIGIKDRQPKIVVIDDKWANRSVINNLLSPIGFEVFEANDGLEGWEKIIEVQPDLIVTDLLMPELDGFEVIKRVRESENFKDTVIIVSSASVFETDQYRSLEAGGNTFIPKPIQATELLQKLQQYLDLEWIYEANEAPLAIAPDTNELIAPPATEMEILYELAMKGNFLEIVKQAVLLEEIDPKYIPFANRLNQMAKDFQDEEILTFIQSYK